MIQFLTAACAAALPCRMEGNRIMPKYIPSMEKSKGFFRFFFILFLFFFRLHNVIVVLQYPHSSENMRNISGYCNTIFH
jgi:hypothetical protein